MKFYLDTSAAVAAFTHEAATARVQDWLGRAGAGQLAVSRWVLTEFSSALALKIRSGALTTAQRARIQAGWNEFLAGEAHMLEVGADAFRHAAEMVAQPERALRAGDALHLAVAAANGCTVVTLDERMAKVAPEVGVAVEALSRA